MASGERTQQQQRSRPDRIPPLATGYWPLILGVLLPASILIGHVETGCHEIGQRGKGLQGIRAMSFQIERCAALGGEAKQIQDALAVAPDSPVIDPDLGSERIR